MKGTNIRQLLWYHNIPNKNNTRTPSGYTHFLKAVGKARAMSVGKQTQVEKVPLKPEGATAKKTLDMGVESDSDDEFVMANEKKGSGRMWTKFSKYFK